MNSNQLAAKAWRDIRGWSIAHPAVIEDHIRKIGHDEPDFVVTNAVRRVKARMDQLKEISMAMRKEGIDQGTLNDLIDDHAEVVKAPFGEYKC